MRRFVKFGVAFVLAGALCLTASPPGAEMAGYEKTARYAGTGYLIFEEDLEGAGSLRGASEMVNNIFGPARCRTNGSFRRADPGEVDCPAGSVGLVTLDVWGECQVESLDYPVSFSTSDFGPVRCSPCYEGFDATVNRPIPSPGCSFEASSDWTVSGEGIEAGIIEDFSETVTVVEGRYDAARRVIVSRTENVFEGTLYVNFRAGESPAYGLRLETPGPGSTVQGIGMISGWSCLGGELEARLSDAAGRVIGAFPLPYGVLRGDTEPVCGDARNGFSAVMNWNLLRPAGEKTISLIQNGEEVASHTFSVVAFEEEFITGAEARLPVEGFPTPGRSVVVGWRESEQRFVITEMH